MRGTISDVYLVLLAAALAILAGVVAVAMGRGGEMAEFGSDRPPPVYRMASAADVAAVRLPFGLLGYQREAADAALRAAAIMLAEQEAEIARLRAHVADSGQQRSRASSPPSSPASSPASSRTPPA